MVQGLNDRYDIVIPGSRIPNWFTHKNVGCSVYVELPRDRYDKYVPKGYAAYVDLSLHESGCIISDSKNTSKPLITPGSRIDQ